VSEAHLEEHRRAAALALVKCCDILKELGIEFVLTKGTLLGYVREKGFAGRPKDLDLLIPVQRVNISKIKTLTQTLDKYGFPVRTSTNFANRVIKTEIYGVPVDFFIYNRIKILFWTHYVRDKDIISGKTLYPIEQIHFFGRNMFIPHDSEYLLRKWYGTSWSVYSPFATDPDKRREDVNSRGLGNTVLEKVTLRIIRRLHLDRHLPLD
jgi:hypothetical protein